MHRTVGKANAAHLRTAGGARSGGDEEILNFIAQDKPDAARQFVNRLRSACDRLSTYPLLGQLCDEFPDRPYRRITVGHHVIYYEVWTEEIAILRVVHGARDLSQIFRDN